MEEGLEINQTITHINMWVLTWVCSKKKTHWDFSESIRNLTQSRVPCNGVEGEMVRGFFPREVMLELKSNVEIKKIEGWDF